MNGEKKKGMILWPNTDAEKKLFELDAVEEECMITIGIEAMEMGGKENSVKN